MSWHLQQINNVNGQGPTVPGEFMACPQATARAFLLSIAVSAFGSQLHFAYFDSGGNIQDCWYDGPTKSWNLRQINNTGGQGPSVPGEDVACPQATATANASGGLCLSVFGDQLHFAYVDSGGNIQDCWYDGPTNSWILRQINNAGGQGPTVPGEDVACPQATDGAFSSNGFTLEGNGITFFVNTFGNQQHFAYLGDGIQDCWYDGATGQWNLQQMASAWPASALGRLLFVCTYGDQQHFAYIDINGNIQDSWFDGPTGRWNLQQITNAPPLNVAFMPGEYVACPQATKTGLGAGYSFFVSTFGNQLHFTYGGYIQDCWYDGPTGRWNLQQINNPDEQGPMVAGEDVACPQATAASGYDPFVCTFGNQQHFAYGDRNGNIQDCWYDGPSGSWNLQQINNANGQGATVPGEDMACPQATAPVAEGQVFVCSFGNQLHFAYLDDTGNIQDCWWEPDEPSPEPNPCQSWIDQLADLSPEDFETLAEYKQAVAYFLGQLHECERAHGLPPYPVPGR